MLYAQLPVLSKAARHDRDPLGIKATIPSKADQEAHRRAKGSKGGRPPVFDLML
ncbi:hypothetical protein OHA25_22805 [Nonomuraea sp. NBC_00507]|uniref:hypothetical protein n=1 Tax=Nonomuraea sp. NBC_00507 TaxID=2976002 RepID=UPI002E1810B3